MEGWLFHTFTLVKVNSHRTLITSSQVFQSNEMCHKTCHLISHKLRDRGKKLIPREITALL